MLDNIVKILGEDSKLLEHKCNTVLKEHLHLPGPDFVDRVWKDSDRDYWMTAQEAKDYGLVDEVLLINPKKMKEENK